jgi:hypothetical protein
MSPDQALIPPPPVVRERLAENIREGRILRALLRLSVRVAQERHRHAAQGPRPEAPRSERGTE